MRSKRNSYRSALLVTRGWGPAFFRVLTGWLSAARYIPLLLLLFHGVSAQADWLQTQTRLVRSLSGDDEQKRTALAEIRNLRSEEASRLAVPALSDSDEMVRATAASSVVFLPKPEAAKVLLPLLDDKKPFVRREAAYALGQVGNTSPTPRMLVLLEKDRDRAVRSAAAAALGGIGDTAAIESLLRLLRKKPTEDEEFIRRSAARSIGQIFDVLNGGNTYTLTPQNFLPQKFKELGGSQPQLSYDVTPAVVVLSHVLQNSKESDDTRREAAFALGAARQPASSSVLRSYLNSPDPYLAEICKESLLKIEKQK